MMSLRQEIHDSACSTCDSPKPSADNHAKCAQCRLEDESPKPLFGGTVKRMLDEIETARAARREENRKS